MVLTEQLRTSRRSSRDARRSLSGASVGGEWRAQQRHVVLLEDRCDRGAVGRPAPGEGAQLLVELVAAAGGVDNDDLARVVGQVEESVRDARGEIGEASVLDVEYLGADLDLVAALES